jgi:hypothetical protein
VVSIQVKYFWDVTLCRLVNIYRCLGEIECFHLAGDATFFQIVGVFFTSEIKALCSIEKSESRQIRVYNSLWGVTSKEICVFLISSVNIHI